MYKITKSSKKMALEQLTLTDATSSMLILFPLVSIFLVSVFDSRS